MKFKYLLLYGIGLILLVLPVKNKVDAFGISVTPASINRSISQEDHIIPLTIKNPGPETLEYFVYVVSMGQNLTGESICVDSVTPSDAPFSLIGHIKFTPNKFILGDGDSQIVEADIQIPTNASGGLYGIIYVEAKPVNDKTQFSGESRGYVTTIPRVGVITLLTFPGESIKKVLAEELIKEALEPPIIEPIKEGEISAVDLVQSKQGAEIYILSTFYNTGNIHLRPEGYVIIRNQAEEEIAKVFIKPVIILPFFHRQLNAIWKPVELQVGRYIAESHITFAGKTLVAKKAFEVISPNEIAMIEGEVASFHIPKTIQYKPISFNILFYNKGNVNLSLEGEVEVKDYKNDLLERVAIKPAKVIPRGSKEVKAILDKGLPMGTYTAIVNVKYLDKVATTMTIFNVLEKEIIQAGEIVEFIIPEANAGNIVIIPKLLFKNTGNINIHVEGMIELKNSQGMSVGYIPVDRIEITPEVVMRLGGTWQGELSPGLYKAKATLIFGDGKMITKETLFLVVGSVGSDLDKQNLDLPGSDPSKDVNKNEKE